jgi:hypothetical protein
VVTGPLRPLRKIREAWERRAVVFSRYAPSATIDG